MKVWIFYSAGAMVLWGMWGFLGKISAQHMPNKTLLVIACLGFAIAFPVVASMYPKSIRFPVGNPYSYYTLLSGLFAGVGVILFYMALETSDASRVVAFTAMYPLITVILSLFFLREQLTVSKLVGISFALAAAFFLSIDSPKP